MDTYAFNKLRGIELLSLLGVGAFVHRCRKDSPKGSAEVEPDILYPRRMRFVFLLLCFLPVCVCTSAGAQQAPSQTAISAVQMQTDGSATRTLSGVITDVDGALVPSATVILRSSDSTQTQRSVTDSSGHFSFSGVEAGAFTLTITAVGMEEASTQGELNPDESLELPPIALRVASASDEVEVSSLTQQELAEQQIREEEKQRLVGLIPNFYVTYDWKAAPLTPKQKYKLAARTMVDPATFIIVGGFAGLEQATNEFSGYGQGAAGYGNRYAAGLADTDIGALLGGAVFPVLFHQDPRYFYKGAGTKWHRTLYALSTAVIARGDNGKWQPAYAGVLGDFASGAISNLYYPASNRNGAGLTIENGLLSVAGDGIGNLLQEFVLKKISSGTKGHGTAQP
jgi:Carboxypeptidase regulatory-like domain